MTFETNNFSATILTLKLTSVYIELHYTINNGMQKIMNTYYREKFKYISVLL